MNRHEALEAFQASEAFTLATIYPDRAAALSAAFMAGWTMAGLKSGQ